MSTYGHYFPWNAINYSPVVKKIFPHFSLIRQCYIKIYILPKWYLAQVCEKKWFSIYWGRNLCEKTPRWIVKCETTHVGTTNTGLFFMLKCYIWQILYKVNENKKIQALKKIWKYYILLKKKHARKVPNRNALLFSCGFSPRRRINYM